MTIKDAYDTWSSSYDDDDNRTRDMDHDATRTMLAGWHNRRMIELGCGTGKNTAWLAKIARSLKALDFSDGMIARAREKVTGNNVEFCKADLTKPWPCTDQSVDLVIANLVLEHIENIEFIFSEAHRVLADDGVFFLCELHPTRQYAGAQATYKVNGEENFISSFIHHTSDYYNAAHKHGFSLGDFGEWWHETDAKNAPRLISFVFEKTGSDKS